MQYLHPFKHKKYDVLVGETLFFNYITFKLTDIDYETFIFDEDENGKLLPINKIIKAATFGEEGVSILTKGKDETENLWTTLKYIGDKELTQEFGKYIAGESCDLNDTPLNWLHKIQDKLKQKGKKKWF